MKLRPRRLGRKTTTLTAIAAVVVVLIGLHYMSQVVVYTLLGALVAVAVEPLGRNLRRVGLPSYFAAGVTIVVVLCVAVALAALVANAFSALSTNFSDYESAFRSFQRTAIAYLRNERLDSIVPVIRSVDVQSGAKATLVDGLVGTANVLGGVFMVLIVTIFIVLEAATFGDKLARMTNGASVAKREARRAIERVQRYLIVKTATSAVTGAMVGVLTHAMGLSSPVLWALLAFALNYVPFIGSLIAAAPAILIAFVELGAPTALSVGIGYLVINTVIGNIVEPRILGSTLGLSPLVVLLSVALWGFILGPIGALLSVPITMVAKIGFEHSERYAWIAILLERGRTQYEVVDALEEPDTSDVLHPSTSEA